MGAVGGWKRGWNVICVEGERERDGWMEREKTISSFSSHVMLKWTT